MAAELTVLGRAQDAGTPYLDCGCPQCEQGLRNHGPAVLVDAAGERILIDAPADVKQRVGLGTVDRVLLTHAHAGHYVGLWYFGKESYDTDDLPLHCSAAMAEWLRGGNKAYHHLVARDNVTLHPFQPGEQHAVGPLTVEPVPVAHRNEDADTVGVLLHGDDRTVYYVPDLDRWTEEAAAAVRAAAVAVVDGTFYDGDELDTQDDVPHPWITATMDRFADADTDIVFTHLNHSNPVLDPESRERETVEDRGFAVAEEDMTIPF